MTDANKNILITTNTGNATVFPKIDFTGFDNNAITLSILDDGTLSFAASSGQLFSITDSLTGTIFSVNDISGIPSIEVLDDGTVRLAELAGNVGIGIAAPSEKLDVVGNVKASGLFIGTATSAQYADLAENYAGDAEYDPGTVVEFGGDEEVTISTTDATPRVAGVVTTNPAHLMNSALAAEYVVALALQGRVPCKVLGPVRKGDMMVSAGNGYARAETAPSMGSVIGKSLEDFNGANGIIEVVVGRL